MIIESRITDTQVGNSCVSRARIVMEKGVTASSTDLSVIHNRRVTGAGEALKPGFTARSATYGALVVKHDSSSDYGSAANLDSRVLAQVIDRRIKDLSFRSRTGNSGAVDSENVMGICCHDKRARVCREHNAIHGRVCGN